MKSDNVLYASGARLSKTSQIDAGRSIATFISASSSKPKRGDFNVSANDRSSDGKRHTRESAIKSLTIVASESFNRSAPAMGISCRFSCRITDSNNGPRRRTRMRISRAWTGRVSSVPRSKMGSPSSIQPLMVAAIVLDKTSI